MYLAFLLILYYNYNYIIVELKVVIIMSKNKYNNDIYTMYEKEAQKNQKITSKYNKLRWEVEELRYDNKKLNNELSNINSIKEKEINKKVEKITKPLLVENQKLQEDLLKAYDEINRLKEIINNNKIDKDYLIDKLNNHVNKNSTNSGIHTSKEIANKIRRLVLIHITIELLLVKKWWPV